MPSGHANLEGFKYIRDVGSVTPELFAWAMSIKLQSAKTWLSNWTTKGYLEYVQPERYTGHKSVGRQPGGKYKINYWHLEEE